MPYDNKKVNSKEKKVIKAMLEDMIKEKVAMTFTWKPNAQAVHGSKTSSHPNYKPGSYKETGSNLYFVALYRWNKKGGSLGDKLVWISFKDEPASDSEAGSKAVLEALIAELNNPAHKLQLEEE